MTRWLILSCILTLPLSSDAASLSVSTYIPKNAYQHLPTVKKEQQLLFPNFFMPEYFAALIEHESCISLTHSKCWNAKSQLKTKRELGVGLGQLTKAYTANGKVRFDSLAGIRKKHIDYLKELTWTNVYHRPDLQIRAMMLMSKDNYQALSSVKDSFQRLAMTDAAYNGGLGGLHKERRTCGLKKNCDPQKWFNHIEKVCLKSKKVLYGNRSACDINRHHVKDVMYTRSPKYQSYFVKAPLPKEEVTPKGTYDDFSKRSFELDIKPNKRQSIDWLEELIPHKT